LTLENSVNKKQKLVTSKLFNGYIIIFANQIKSRTMKKIFLFFLLISTISFASAQVFNTGQTLKPKAFSIGIEPAVFINGGADFILFLHGGAGLTKGVDFGLTIGVLGPDEYFGADVEFAIAKNMSIAAGAHHFGNFGIDGTFNLTFPIRQDVRLFTGADLDVNFPKDNVSFLLWLPIGVEIGLKSNMSFIFEAEIGLTSPSYHLIGGGLNFYF
jgi:hypothetical protein